MPSSPAGKASLHQRHLRLMQLSTAIVSAALGHGRPELVVVEGPAFSRTLGHAHDRSGLWWAVVRALSLADVPVAEVAPTGRAKYITGSGQADKDTCTLAVERRYGALFAISNHDEADAVALCDMGCAHLGHPLATVPARNREALAAVAWPIPGETA